jgi:hypothetical protein
MCRRKEPQFFSFDELYKQGAEYHNSIFKSDNPDTKIYGESSQSYFVHERAIDRIQQSLSAPKIILLLRHPVERLLSHYRWNYKLTVETASLEEALRERGDDTSYDFDPRVNMYRENGGYLAFSRYSTYVPKWTSSFGEGNVLLLRTQDLKDNQQQVASACFRFLCLDDYKVVETISRNETATTTRLFDSLPWYLKAPAALIPRPIKDSEAYDELRRIVTQLRTPSPPQDIPQELKDRIVDSLEDDIAFYEDIPALT